jgi:hypothetical protein
MPGADEPFAGLWRARRVVLVLWSIALVAALVAAAASGSGARVQLATGVRALDLSALAFAPAGTVARAPAAAHPAVDLRFVPGAPELR